jgi:antitoxin component YwqK of YwqJK toxin-antitoxin module
MKNHIIISLLFLSVGLSQKEYDINHIVLQNGVYIKKFSDEIVNGKVFQMGGDMKVPLGKMKDGKKEGKWMVWYKNGQKEEEGTYKDGKRDGLYTEWYENGQKKKEGTSKDGERDGLWTWWYEDGQKRSEGPYKDGKPDGLHVQWYENGKKRGEGTFKDGKIISQKEWNEDGSVME